MKKFNILFAALLITGTAFADTPKPAQGTPEHLSLTIAQGNDLANGIKALNGRADTNAPIDFSGTTRTALFKDIAALVPALQSATDSAQKAIAAEALADHIITNVEGRYDFSKCAPGEHDKFQARVVEIMKVPFMVDLIKISIDDLKLDVNQIQPGVGPLLTPILK